MVQETVLSIINSARGRIRLPALTAADFDSGTEGDHLELRNEFMVVYKKLSMAEGFDFIKKATITTNSTSNSYLLPTGIAPEQITSDYMQLIDTGANEDLTLFRMPYDEVERIYVDLDEIEKGRPSRWFLFPTTTAGSYRLGFINAPDAVYTIQLQAAIDSGDLTADDNVQCSNAGVVYLIDRLTYYLHEVNGIPTSLNVEESWRRYICQGINISSPNSTPTPYQHL